MLQAVQQLKEQLVSAVNREGQVIDESTVLRVIIALEKMPVAAEILEVTRIGKLVNELRKKVKDDNLARRAKRLIQQWQKLVPGSSEISSGASTPNGQIKPRTAKCSELTLRLQGMTNVQRDSPLTSSQTEQSSDVSTLETSVPPLEASVPPENGIETDAASPEVQYEIDMDPPMFHRQWHGVDGRESVGHFFDWTVKMPMEGSEDGVVQPYVNLEY